MGDEAGTAQTNRQGGEKSREGIADEGLKDDDGQGEGFDVRLGDHEVPKWIRPALWAGVPVVLLALYLFALPVPIIFLENKDLLNSGGPKFYAFMEAAFFPISWLYENVEVYQRYIDWWELRLA